MKLGQTSATVLLMVLFFNIPAFAIEPESSCQALQNWAAGLEKLPADYASYSELNDGQRLAVYQRLSSAERAHLWQEQMREALRSSAWEPAQRTLIDEVGRFVTTESVAALRAGEGPAFELAHREFRSLEDRVKAAFPVEDARRLFFQLGRAGEVGALRLCNCNRDSLPCSTGFACGPAVCMPTEQGCGFLAQEACDGRC